MPSVVIARRIEAPIETVFDAVADPRRFAEAVGGVIALEFLTESQRGAGTCFRQTRVFGGREMAMDFDVTECIPNERVRIVNVTGRTVWDSLITLEVEGSDTALTMRMDARAEPLLLRLFLRLVCRFIRKAVAGDIDAVKAYCEKRTG